MIKFDGQDSYYLPSQSRNAISLYEIKDITKDDFKIKTKVKIDWDNLDMEQRACGIAVFNGMDMGIFCGIYEGQRIIMAQIWTYGKEKADMEEVYMNGHATQRVAGNANISFNFVEGESLLMSLRELAVSSGSACTSASLEPSYVLRALGMNDELAHSSIRFSIGRFTTEADIDEAIALSLNAVNKLRELSPLWDMYKDGVDLDTVQWAAH